jgi:hypothetical protein
MKNQYFGDINDYRKYGLLRAITATSGLRLGVCWLLTANDDRPDGEFRRYLEEPERWRSYDPELYAALQRLLQSDVDRKVTHAEYWDLLPGATYHHALLADPATARQGYFAAAWNALQDCPILFFDPDNGIEVKSVRYGGQNSPKYLYWREISEAYERGHSLVIYQHFPRKERSTFISGLAHELRERLGAPAVNSFRTSHVVFFLVVRPEHAPRFEAVHDLVLRRWAGQIKPAPHVIQCEQPEA